MPARSDVLVVGSGPAGTAVARRLAEHGRTVLILEQGPAILDPPGSHIRNASHFRSEPDAYLGAATGHLDFFDDSVPRDNLPGAAVTRALGGQGTIWTNLCPRGDAPWDALSPEQWDTYYGVAEQYLGVQSEGFELSVRQQRIRSKLGESLAANGRAIATLPTATQFDGDDYLNFSAPHDIVAGSPVAAERIRTSHATVDTLIGHAGKITGVTVGSETIEADDVVVAAGAIGTPQLLHRSKIRPVALGRWLSYHPILVAQLVLDEGLCAVSGVRDRVPRLQIPPTETADWYTLILRDVSPFQPEEPDVAVEANRLTEIQVLCPVDIDERKGIHFDDLSRPTFDMPLSTDDKARLADAITDSDEITAVLGRYRNGCHPTWMPFGFAHMTGTTRMSAADDGTGVTDYEGRVWGFDNLYLATNGLVPTRMAVNPTLTGVALAAHVADSIVNG